MKTYFWLLIAIVGWLALVAFTCRWFHVCKRRREVEEGVMRSVTLRVNETDREG